VSTPTHFKHSCVSQRICKDIDLFLNHNDLGKKKRRASRLIALQNEIIDFSIDNIFDFRSPFLNDGAKLQQYF